MRLLALSSATRRRLATFARFALRRAALLVLGPVFISIAALAVGAYVAYVFAVECFWHAREMWNDG